MNLIKPIRKYVSEFKDLSASRKISILFLISFIIIAQSVSIISVVAIFDTAQIIYDTAIPCGLFYFYLDPLNSEEMEAEIPFCIRNEGWHDLTNIYISSSLKIRYVNNSTKLNQSRSFFAKSESIGSCGAFSILSESIWGNSSCFNVSAVAEFFETRDTSYPYSILGDFQISAQYFLGLIAYTTYIYNALLW